MELRAVGTRIRADPLLLLVLALALVLGHRTALSAVMLALGLHESAHLLVALRLGVRVRQLRLMPFGGEAQLDNLYTLPPSRLFWVAAAGPAANLLVIVCSAALCQWGALSPALSLLHLRVNLALMLFNLLPALPLDGGRMLYALTAGPLGRNRAAQLGIWLGRAVAAGLIAWLLRDLWVIRQFNISLAACAVFILASAPEERRALSELRATSPLNALRAMGEPLTLRLCAVSAECPTLRVLRNTAPDAATLFAIYEGDRLTALTDEVALLEAALQSPDTPVGHVPGTIRLDSRAGRSASRMAG